MANKFVSTRVEDALFLQARGVVGVEFEDWIGNLSGILNSNDRGPACLTLLRQLYVLTAATKHRRNLSPEIYKLLMSLVLEPEQGSTKLRLIAANILRELSPSKHIEIHDFSPPVEHRNIPYVLPVALAQSNARDKLSELAPKLVEWLIGPRQEADLSLALLHTFHGICTHSRALEHIEGDQLLSISHQLAMWLKQASKNSLPAPTTGISLFGGGGKKQLIPVKEIDGTPSQGMFTVLNLGGFYSTDQLLNVSAFSTLRRWIFIAVTSGGGAGSPSVSLSATPTPDQESRSGSYSSGSHSSILTSSFPPTASSPLAPSLSGGTSLTASLISYGAGGRSRHSLKEAALQYCLRVIEQCERNPTRSDDYRLIDACLYECISILDLLCSLSASLIHTVFPRMRILYARITKNPTSNSRLLLILLKFFVNHGESEMYDLDALVELFFGEVLSKKFDDAALAYEVVSYLVDNVEKLHTNTNIFTKFFPNILKILAWFPVTFAAEFIQLLPAFITDKTSSEVLHSILDLPCLAATLQAQYIISASLSSGTDISISHPGYSKSLAAFQDGTHKFLFRHFLRSKNGKGDTIDKMRNLHHLLLDYVNHERVKAVARVAPLMMSVFFKTIFYGGKSRVTIQLATVLLERITLLYNLEPFISEARKVMAKYLLLLYKLHPHLIVDQHVEILDFLSNLRMLTSGGEHCYMHLVWIVGEYSHAGYDPRCSTALLDRFFGTLESVAYEIGINFQKNKNFTTRLLMVLMSTIAKIASRCQDLIPRALLCLNKIVQLSSDAVCDQDTHRILLNRANELVNILKIPSLASAVLSPPATTHQTKNEEMKGQTNIAHLLQSTSNHLNVKI